MYLFFSFYLTCYLPVPLGACYLQVAESRFQPQLIVYNAGTDILDGDPLGRLKVTFGTIHISQKKCLLKQSNMFPTKSGFCSSNSWVSYLSCEQDK